MSEFTHFSPRCPQQFTVKGGEQTSLSVRTSSQMYNVLYITNNGDDPIYLGFTGPGDTTGNAKPMHGITVFPKSTFVFDDPVPSGCVVWATCEEGKEVIVGVQQ